MDKVVGYDRLIDDVKITIEQNDKLKKIVESGILEKVVKSENRRNGVAKYVDFEVLDEFNLDVNEKYDLISYLSVNGVECYDKYGELYTCPFSDKYIFSDELSLEEAMSIYQNTKNSIYKDAIIEYCGGINSAIRDVLVDVLNLEEDKINVLFDNCLNQLLDEGKLKYFSEEEKLKVILDYYLKNAFYIESNKLIDEINELKRDGKSLEEAKKIVVDKITLRCPQVIYSVDPLASFKVNVRSKRKFASGKRNESNKNVSIKYSEKIERIISSGLIDKIIKKEFVHGIECLYVDIEDFKDFNLNSVEINELISYFNSLSIDVYDQNGNIYDFYVVNKDYKSNEKNSEFPKNTLLAYHFTNILEVINKYIETGNYTYYKEIYDTCLASFTFNVNIMLGMYASNLNRNDINLLCGSYLDEYLNDCTNDMEKLKELKNSFIDGKLLKYVISKLVICEVDDENKHTSNYLVDSFIELKKKNLDDDEVLNILVERVERAYEHRTRIYNHNGATYRDMPPLNTFNYSYHGDEVPDYEGKDIGIHQTFLKTFGDVISTLAIREQQIIAKRVGLITKNGRPYTIEEIAKEYGRTVEYIQDVENSAINRMKKMVDKGELSEGLFMQMLDSMGRNDYGLSNKKRR